MADVTAFLGGLRLKDAAKVEGVLDELGITSSREWLLLSPGDLTEALQALKDATVALGDRNKLRHAQSARASFNLHSQVPNAPKIRRQ